MISNKSLITGGLLAGLLAASAVFAQGMMGDSQPGYGYGPGMMGQSQPYGMPHHRMRPGMGGPGMGGPGMRMDPERMSDAQVDQMAERMATMYSQMKAIAEAQDPAQRRALVREHLRNMQAFRQSGRSSMMPNRDSTMPRMQPPMRMMPPPPPRQ